LKTRAVIFDLDGTLLNTLDDLADSMNASLLSLGLSTHPVESYKLFVGDGVVELARRALPADHRDEQTLDAAVRAMRENYARRWDNKTRPYDGVHEMLDALTARGIRLAVLTNKPHDFAELCVEKLLPREKFDLVVGVSDEIPPKPDPAGVEYICRTLDVTRSDVLYLGDTNTDMKTAVSAGLYAIGVTWGFRSAEELTAAGARVLIHHPIQLLELLESDR